MELQAALGSSWKHGMPDMAVSNSIRYTHTYKEEYRVRNTRTRRNIFARGRPWV